MTLRTACVAAALAVAAAPAPAVGQFALDSDAAFSAWATSNQFTQFFGGHYRWGYTDGARSWEVSVVDGSGLPLDPQEYEWHRRDYWGFAYDPLNVLGGWLGEVAAGTGINFSGPALSMVDDASGLVTNPVNTLLVRAGASDNNAIHSEFGLLSFATGSFLFTSMLGGDSNGNFVGFQDSRLASGFVVFGRTALLGGNPDGGDDPAMQLKVGSTTSVVPEPISMLLLGSGLAGVAGVARRRRRDQA